MIDDAAAQIQSIGEVVRLAVAPVFLLSGVGIMLTVMTNRLARTVDRARQLEARAGDTSPQRAQSDLHGPLEVFARRARLLGYSITLLTLCALLVSMVVVMLFLGAFFDFAIVRTIGVLFIAAMCTFVAALLCFLREVFIATGALRIGVRR